VHSKVKDSSVSGCRTWNRLLLGCNPGQLSFILRAVSDTLPTSVNFKHWHIHGVGLSAHCVATLAQPTTAHVLGGCPSSLKQGHFTYRHTQVLHCLTTELTRLFSEVDSISVYANVCKWLSTSNNPSFYHCYLVPSRYYGRSNSVELTCPLDSINSARDQERRSTKSCSLSSGIPCQCIFMIQLNWVFWATTCQHHYPPLWTVPR